MAHRSRLQSLALSGCTRRPAAGRFYCILQHPPAPDFMRNESAAVIICGIMPPGPGITETKLSASIKGEALQRCECSHSVEPIGIEPGSRPPPAPFPTGTVQQIVMMQLALGPANARSRPGNPLPQNRSEERRVGKESRYQGAA